MNTKKSVLFLLMMLLINTFFLTTTQVAVAATIQGTQVEVCNTPNLTIPDNDTNGVDNVLTISENGLLNDIDVTVSATHQEVNHLVFTLTHGSTTITLLDRPGYPAHPRGCIGKDLQSVILDDAASSSVENSCTANQPAYPGASSYKPDNPLSAFNNQNINGNWTLKVSDVTSENNSVPGTLTKWCLKYQRQTVATLDPLPVLSVTFTGSPTEVGTPLFTPPTFTITNGATSVDDLWIYSVSLSNFSPAGTSGNFQITQPTTLPTPTNPIKIVPGQWYDFAAKCTPTTEGVRTADFIVTTNLNPPWDNIKYTLQCEGQSSKYDGSAIANPVDFGTKDVGAATGIQTVTVKNSASVVNLKINSASITGANISDFSIISTTFPMTIGPGSSSTIDLKCTPQAHGIRSAKLKLTTNDPANATVYHNLQCEGKGLTYNPAPSSTLNFGATTVNTPVSKTISIANNSTIQSWSISDGKSGAGVAMFDFSFAINNPILAGGTNNATVTCTPTTEGTYLATLTLTPAAPNPPVSYTLKCSAATNLTTDAVYDSDPLLPGETFDTGSSLVGTPHTSIFTVSEIGSAANLQLTAVSINNDFQLVSPTIPVTIAKGTTQTVTVRCTPSVKGTRTGTLQFTTNATNYPTASYPLTCKGLLPGYGSAPSPGSLLTFSDTKIGDTTAKLLTVNQTGDADLHVTFTGISGTHASDFKVKAPSPFPFTLAGSGGSKPVNLECSPTGLGDRLAKLELSSDDPAIPNPIYYNLKCKGLQGVGPFYDSTPITPGGTIDFGTTFVGVAKTGTFNAIEVGSQSLQVNIPASPITGTHAGDFALVSPTSNFVISDGGAANTVTVQCNPTAVGLRQATLTLVALEGGAQAPNNKTYTLKCTGDFTPKYGSTVAPSSTIDFGTNNWVGEEVQQTLTIKEQGTADLTVDLAATPITGTNPGDFAIDTSKFPLTIADGGANVPVTVTCNPSAMGPRTAILNLTTNDPLALTVSYPLSCTGKPTPKFNSSPLPNSTLDCGGGPVGVSITTKKIQILETGTADLQVTSATITDNTSGDFAIDPAVTLPVTVTDGDATGQPLTLKITPSVAMVQHTATLTLTTNDPLQSTYTYNLTCTAGTTPFYKSSPPQPGDTIDFGQTPTDVPVVQAFDVEEAGTADLTVELPAAPTPAITGTHAGDFTLVDTSLFPFTITKGSGDKKTIQIRCLPQGGGVRTAQLTLVSNDPLKLSPTYTLTCEGLPPGYGSTPAPGSPLNCGASGSQIGVPITYSFDIQETGIAPLKIDLAATSITGTNASEFSLVASPFPLTIADGGTAQTVTLQSIPAGVGTRTAQLNLVTNDLLQPTITYPLTCDGLPTPVYNSTPLLPGGTLDFGIAPYNEPVRKTFDIQEQGTADLTVTTPKITGPHTDDFTLISSPFPFTIPVGSGVPKTVTIQCQQTSPLEIHTATLTVTTNDPLLPNPSYKLRCTGQATPGYDSTPPVSGDTIDFGTTVIGTPITQTFAILEVGTANLTVSLADPAITGPYASEFTVMAPTFPLTIPEGGNPQTLVMQCTPSAIGTRTATLHLVTNDPLNPTLSYPLTCDGEPQPASIGGSSLLPSTLMLTVLVNGQGTGQVTSTPAGIDCHKDKVVGCNAGYNPLTQVTLTPVAAAGSVFSNWGGHDDCADGVLTMGGSKLCVAYFNLLQTTLTVTVAGNGTVSSSPAGIQCKTGGQCVSNYPTATSVTLTGTPDTGWQVAGWRGDCSNAGNVTMNSHKQCQAVFEPVPTTPTTPNSPTTPTTPTTPGQATLTVQNIGSGTGSVLQNFAVGSATGTLTAIPDSGSIFMGWAGACSGMDTPITVTLNQTMTCTAQFDLLPPTPPNHHLLTVIKIGLGNGVVFNEQVQCGGCHNQPQASSEQVQYLNENIHCGNEGAASKCQAAYPEGTTITLTAQPNENSLFAGWSGDCEMGTTNLTTKVTLNSDKRCVAQFDPKAVATSPGQPPTTPLPGETTPPPDISLPPQTLTVTKGGQCTGSILSFPEGILLSPPYSNGLQASMTYPQNTVIDLVATPDIGCQWVGFSGDDDCADQQVMLTKNVACVGTFEPATASTEETETTEPEMNCPLTGEVGIYCNYKGWQATDLTVTSTGNISTVVLQGTIINNGWISNATITPSSTVTGGVLSGYIVNEGILSDFEFRGAILKGGTLSGNIINKNRGILSEGGIVQDVSFAPNTYFKGGKLRGRIEGDAQLPVLIEAVQILPGSYLTNVIIGEDVKIGKNVTLGPGVVFLDGSLPAEASSPPAEASSPPAEASSPPAEASSPPAEASSPPVSERTPTVINGEVDGKGKVMRDVTIGPDGKLVNVILQGTIVNEGVIEDATLEDCNLTGGILGGVIVNHCVLTDMEFRGSQLSGGVLAGTITVSRQGVLKDLLLAPAASLKGGKCSGKIQGDAMSFATLESIVIEKDCEVENVIVGDNVKTRGTLTNIEFRGKMLVGGTLGGTIRNTGDGLIQDVKFAENAHLIGGKVGGSLDGNAKGPALAEEVNAKALTHVKYVIFKGAKALKLEHLDVGPGVEKLPGDTTDTKIEFVDAKGEVVTDATVGERSTLSNAQLQGTIVNRGVITNVTLLPDSTLTGGVLMGEIINQGTLTNVEFAGTMLSGGLLWGTILNTKGGLIKEVRLAPSAHLKGGKLQGRILGDVQEPALLEDLTILPGSDIDNVIIGENVQITEDVKFGQNVKFLYQPTVQATRFINDQQDAKGERWRDVMVGTTGHVSNVVLEGDTLNQGVLENVTLPLDATVTGGVLTGQILNQGTLNDVEFQGTELTGGVLGGQIKVTRQGILYNVRLRAKAYLIGGYLKGRLEGDEENPPMLEGVTILPESYAANLIVGEKVENYGTLANFELRGAALRGGTIAGKASSNGKGIFQDVSLGANAEVRGVRLKGKIRGDAKAPALIERVRIDSDGEVENVIIGEDVTNEGSITNAEFRGQFLKGGRLGGKIVITNKGILENVYLMANASVTGGSVQGDIIGESADEPALLENLIVPAGIFLDNVIIGDNVTLPKTARYGRGVRFLKINFKQMRYIQGEVLTDVTVEDSDSFENVVLQGKNRNKGRLHNVTLRKHSTLTGGRLSGEIYNEGMLIEVEFEGTLLIGGELAGTIKNTRNGTIKEVRLAARTRLSGGKLQGRILGDAQALALLSKVVLLEGTFVDNVIIGDDVELEDNVTFGPGVKFEKQPKRRTSTTINDVVDGQGQVFQDVTIGPQGKLFNAVLAGKIQNQGVLEDVTVQIDSIVTGGILTGVIINQGTVSDFEFQGTHLTGGVVAGTVRNTQNGILQDLKLAPQTRLVGGKLKGRIEGDMQYMAYLESVTILEYSYVIYVIIEGTVENFGTLANIEFRGDLIKGGVLEGLITTTAAGLLQDLRLAANAILKGGHLTGKITGDVNALPLLEHLLIEAEGYVEYVAIGEQVINQGTLANFELRGSLLAGGTVSGSVKVTQFGELRSVHLAGNTQITGGTLAGIIKGEANAPALLESVAVASMTYLENVVLGETTSVSAYVTFGPQVTTSTQTVLTSSTNGGQGVDAQGRLVETKARFTSEVKTATGKAQNQSELTLEEARQVKFTTTLAIDPQHLGQPGEVIVTVKVKRIGVEGTFMRPANNQYQWLPWDGDPQHLQPMQVYDKLPKEVPITIFDGDLSKIPGDLTVSVGYRLADGTLIYNQTPANVSVPLPEGCKSCHAIPMTDDGEVPAGHGK